MSDHEQPVNLTLWWMDGAADYFPNRPRKGFPVVSIGRVDSKRGLGVLVWKGAKPFPKVTVGGKEVAAFVLDKQQVRTLHRYLGRQLRRLKDGAK